jgi:hypothetical protein
VRKTLQVLKPPTYSEYTATVPLVPFDAPAYIGTFFGSLNGEYTASMGVYDIALIHDTPH